ncbi:MAG: hypothetical protein RSE41_08315 [Clostridia bacterium]|uniref:hypothetical protein n=1 Tax=Clostridium sp. TaxID=1506 RepID=UPI002FC59E8A
MAKKGFRTCKECKMSLPMEEMEQVTSKTYMCSKCYETVGKESKDYNLLISYICKVFKLDKPTGMILNQVKKYHNLGYSYAGIAYTIEYFFLIEKKLHDKVSIGFVPYYYEQARQHNAIKAKVAESTIGAQLNEEITIHTSQIRRNSRSKTRFIDISKL